MNQKPSELSVPAGWELKGKAITKTFVFKDFVEAFAFMTAAAAVAERMNHHPEWSNVYNKVTVRLTTHDAGDVTKLDLEMAAAMNQLAEQSL